MDDIVVVEGEISSKIMIKEGDNQEKVADKLQPRNIEEENRIWLEKKEEKVIYKEFTKLQKIINQADHVLNKVSKSMDKETLKYINEKVERNANRYSLQEKWQRIQNFLENLDSIVSNSEKSIKDNQGNGNSQDRLGGQKSRRNGENVSK